MEAFTQWLDRLNQRMAIKSGIFVCERIIKLSPHIHYVEWMKMHDLAVVVKEKLERDLEDLK
jgi:hypothetical protein